MNALGIDIGASTIDLAMLRDGRVLTRKFARRYETDAADLIRTLEAAAQAWSVGIERLDEVRIGSTGAINRLLKRDGARVGLITTTGFADTLELARQNRADLYDPVARSPAPTFLVEAGAIFEVDGRIDPAGTELSPLSSESVVRAGIALRDRQVEAIAVCLLFSHIDPAHERACAAVLAGIVPGVPVILSHRVDARVREYERTVSTCLEASLSATHASMVSGIAAALRERGFGGRLLFADSRGLLVPADIAASSASPHLLGGPAAAALFSAHVVRELGVEQALAIDIGSTTTDISLVDGATAATTHNAVVAGVPMRFEMADIESVAFGGGSAVDALLAEGPAAGGGRQCEATFSDALACLGLVPADAAPDAGHRMTGLAETLGRTVAELAGGALDAAADRIAVAVMKYAVARNVDPAAVPLIAGGGLGRVLGHHVAERLGTRRVVYGTGGAASGAAGLLLSRRVHEAVHPVNMPLSELTDAQVAEVFAGLAAASADAARGSARFTVAPTAFMHPVTLDIGLTGGAVANAARLRSAFEAYHLRFFGSPPRESGFVFSSAYRCLEEPLPVAMAPDESERGAAVPAGWVSRSIGGASELTRRAAAGPLRPQTLQMRLNAIAQSMQEILFRTAVSPVVREGNDAAAGLLDPGGEVVALSDAIPLLLGALGTATRAILSRFPADAMREGELFLTNDPYSGGTHLPDITVVAPVFHDGALVAFAATMLHHQDVGGMRAGSVPPDAAEIFQEGLRLPPMRMGSGAHIDDHVVGLFSANSRAPATVLGDLASQVAATRQASSSLRKLVAETGAAAFAQGLATCLNQGEAQARATIASMKPGSYRASERLDPMPRLPDISIELQLRVGDGLLRADFSGTSAPVPAPINCVRSGPVSATFFSLLSAMGDTVFRNEGAMRAVELVLPDNCAINAGPPAAVNARTGIVRSVTSALLQALAGAFPGRMPAANSGMSYVLAFSGTRPDGQRFIVTEIIAGGAGGGPHGDGASGISTDVGNAMNMSAELLESQLPLCVESARVRRGSGGAGRFRGGDGITRTYLALQDAVSVSLRGERFHHVPEGLFSGGSPQPAAARVVRADGSVEQLATRSTPILHAGDRLVVESCGGAGYGVDG